MKSEHWHFDFSIVLAFRINWADAGAEAGILETPKANPIAKRAWLWPFERANNATPRDIDYGTKSSLNPTRHPKHGIPLSVEEISILQTAVLANHPAHEIALCYMPHHAILFLNDQHEIVGHLDICFQCANYRCSPAGYAQHFDLEAIHKLFLRLEIPIFNPEWETAG